MGFFCEKFQSFDELFSREISRTFVMECVNMGWQAYATPEYVAWFSRLRYIFALTSTSLSERPFLYDTMGGSLKIWFSDGCCCMRYHFLIKISLRFGTPWWYCVMKNKIRFCFVSLEEYLCPFFMFHFWECVVNKILWIASFHKLFFICGNVFFKCFAWRVYSILTHES